MFNKIKMIGKTFAKSLSRSIRMLQSGSERMPLSRLMRMLRSRSIFATEKDLTR